MLTLNASYSKKVPAGEKFSSQSYLASVEVELPHGMNASELKTRIHETFELVKQSVENEIAAGRPGHTEAPADTPPKATHNQIGYILKLAQQKEKGLGELNEMALRLFRAPSIYELSKRDASSLLDQLKKAA